MLNVGLIEQSDISSEGVGLQGLSDRRCERAVEVTDTSKGIGVMGWDKLLLLLYSTVHNLLLSRIKHTQLHQCVIVLYCLSSGNPINQFLLTPERESTSPQAV